MSGQQTIGGGGGGGGSTSPLTTKGDVWGYSSADARIPVGTNGQVLTADSTQSLGLKWAPAAGGVTSINADTTAAQLISGTSPVSASTAAGTTTISMTAAGAAASGYMTTGTQTIAGTKLFTGVFTIGGTGGATPFSSPLTVVATETDYYRAGGQGPLVFCLQSGGSQGSPSQTLSGILVGAYLFGGYDGTSWSNTAGVAGIRCIATENYSTSAQGAKLRLSTVKNTTAAQLTALTLEHDGRATFASGFAFNRTANSGTSYTTLISDSFVGQTSTSSAVTITLVAVASVSAGFIQIIKDESGGAATHNITVQPTAGTIDGLASVSIIANYGALRVYTDGTNWFTF